MIIQIEEVKEFMEKFEQTYNTEPALLTEKQYNLRYNLMQEENNEYLQACKDENKVEILDALVDQLYILLGSVLSHGLQDVYIEAFHKVHENNLTKLDENGKVMKNEHGKVIKPKNYKPIKLDEFIDNFDRYKNHGLCDYEISEQTIFDIIQMINIKLLTVNEDAETLNFNSDGIISYITYYDEMIWSSIEQGDREIPMDSNECENFCDFLIRNINTANELLASKLVSIKI